MENKEIIMSKTLKASICYSLALISFVIIRILSSYGAFTSFKGFSGDLAITIIIQIFCITLVPLCFYRLLSKEQLNRTFKDFGYRKIKKNTFLLCIFMGIIAYFLNISASSIWNFFLYLIGYSSRGVASSTAYTNIFDLFIALISTAVLPAFCEEFLHRGMMQGLINKEKGYVFSVIIVSILFGLFHLNIYQTGYATFLGILMGFLAVFADSIYPAIIIHFMNNAINVLVGFVMDTSSIGKKIFLAMENFINKNMLLTFIVCAILLIALCYIAFLIFVKIIKNEKLENCNLSTKQIAFSILNFNEKDKNSLKSEQDKLNVDFVKNELKKSYPKHKEKLQFKDFIVLITIFFLSGLITMFTLVWGIL